MHNAPLQTNGRGPPKPNPCSRFRIAPTELTLEQELGADRKCPLLALHSPLQLVTAQHHPVRNSLLLEDLSLLQHHSWEWKTAPGHPGRTGSPFPPLLLAASSSPRVLLWGRAPYHCSRNSLTPVPLCWRWHPSLWPSQRGRGDPSWQGERGSGGPTHPLHTQVQSAPHRDPPSFQHLPDPPGSQTRSISAPSRPNRSTENGSPCQHLTKEPRFPPRSIPKPSSRISEPRGGCTGTTIPSLPAQG